MKRACIVVLLLVLGSACGEAFKPETLVDGFRVLGIRATPAELAPGQTAVLEGLVVDPSRPGKANTVLWLGCDPDPFNLGRSACSDTSTLGDPAALAVTGADGAVQLPPGMHLIGLNDRAAYQVPADTFSQLPAEDVRRQVGTVAQVLAFAVAEEVSPLAPREELQALFERVRRREVASTLTLFRLRVSEEGSPNSNPKLLGLAVNGQALPQGATLRVESELPVQLSLLADESSFERYQQLGPTGEREEKTEALLSAWYASTGSLSEPRLISSTETVQSYVPPGSAKDPLPADRTGKMWIVVRDTRGGQTWLDLPLFVCDRGISAPVLSALEPASGAGDGTFEITLYGNELSAVLDVMVGGKALLLPNYFETQRSLTGFVPALPSGLHAVTLRGRNCADVDTGLSFRVP